MLAVRLTNALTGQKRRARRFLASRASPVYLNLGSGPRGRAADNWVNSDGYRDRNVHFLFDFSRRWPFPPGSFDGVFCEHVIEHFAFDDGQRVFGEIWRVLRPGGVVRLVVPDAEHIVRTYFDDPDGLIAYRGVPGLTAMQVVNDFFRQRYEHQFLYDWETMRQALAAAGFISIARRDHGTGQCPALLIDDAKYAWESLYVEAVKPVDPA